MEFKEKIRIFFFFSLIILYSIVIGCSKNNQENRHNPFAELEKQLQTHPVNVKLIVKLAKLYQFNGQPEKAIELLKEKKLKIPDNPMLEIWYANAESMMASKAKEVQEKVKWSQFAIGDLDQTVEKYPNNWYVRFIRGKNSLNWPAMFHRKKIAIQDFEYLLQFNQENPGIIPDTLIPDIMYNLAEVYRENDNTIEKSTELLKQIVEQFPQSAEASKIKQLQSKKES